MVWMAKHTGIGGNTALVLVELGERTRPSLRFQCYDKGRAGKAGVPTSGAGDANPPTTARKRQRMRAGEHERAGGAEETLREGDGVVGA